LAAENAGVDPARFMPCIWIGFVIAPVGVRGLLGEGMFVGVVGLGLLARTPLEGEFTTGNGEPGVRGWEDPNGWAGAFVGDAGGTAIGAPVARSRSEESSPN
jgi:hypothetical protein